MSPLASQASHFEQRSEIFTRENARAVRSHIPCRSMRIADTEQTLPVAILLSAAGGFLDAFTWIGHGQVFANAQSGNIVLLGLDIAQFNWLDASRRFLPIIAFVGGVFCADFIRLAIRRGRAQVSVLSLCFEVCFLLLVAITPNGTPDMVVVMGVSFLAAMQGTNFNKFERWSFSSVTMTSNLRRVAQSFYADGTFSWRNGNMWQGVKFASVVFSFCCGAGVGGVLTAKFGEPAAAGGALILALAVLELVKTDVRHKEPNN